MGDEEPMFIQVGPQFLEDWSDDGRFVAYRDQTPETGDNLWILPLNGERKPFPFLRTRFEEWGARFSPDSRWVAFVSNDSGRNEVYVAPADGSAGRKQISIAGGIAPRWRANGRELFYVSSDGKAVMAVGITLSPALQPKAPVQLFAISRDTELQARLLNMAYDVHPDGQRFLFSVAARKTPPAQIAIVLNWPALLQQ